MTSSSRLQLQQQLCFPLYSLSRQVTQAYQPLLKPLGLTYPQYLVMLVLWQAREEQRLPLAVGELCRELQLDTGTVTPLLKRMEANGLLQRRRSTQDERRVMIELTADGLSLKTRAESVPEQLLCRLQVSPQELQQMRDLLQSWQRQLSQLL
ncbi:MarR family transcriptional regulator [Bacterioplanes sanyensis]|uniref:MarR family transcriptional regulator n=1 Tax=Bacterioplanes sanyensis TaxID=1249553 RepID=A0A222FLP0_9GAMM|nr:MarR family transcriptional regulator [Bacterioplanes sanyensis]ASP39582.1 MarR family transcriptional regulator [Bacterioplanes sanyensis]